MKTPEQLEAAGIELKQIPWDPKPRACFPPETSEYWIRLKAQLPMTPPRFRVGDWAHNYISNENARVVAVYWDAGLPYPQWRYHVPGFGTPELGGTVPGAPYVEYEPTNSCCWRRVVGPMPLVQP